MVRVEHAFSIVMSSRDHIKKIKVSDDRSDSVVFEGALGELRGICLDEGVMLEISGANGVLRIDLTREEVSSALAREPSGAL